MLASNFEHSVSESRLHLEIGKKIEERTTYRRVR
jgi:hypothetical protein